jgi:PAS domain S-box-containing protein
MTESEDRLRTAIDAAEMGIGHWNRSVGRISFSGHVRRVFGCDPADLPDSPHALLDLVHPDERETVATRLLATANNGGRFDADVRLRQPDGRYEWVSAQAQCHADADGRCEDVVVTARNVSARRRTAVGHDVTDLKRLEAQLLQAQKMETVGRLAGGVAHDFNNLLTIILGSLELLRLGGPGRSAAHLENIETAATQASHLTRQLLAFSRQQIVEPKVVDLNELITDARRMLVRLINEDIELTTLPRPDLWKVCVDPMQVMQVLVNLVVNARDAMPKGGKLTIETDNVLVDNEYLDGHAHVTPGDFVMLAVSDTGVGIADSVKPHLFEPFFTTKDVGKGTGLGLATSYGIIKQGGGFIWPYSEEGSGATFKVYLPRAADGVVAAKEVPRPDATSLPRGTETVLVVEDSDLLRQMASETLLRQGYTVLAARDGVEALNLLARDPRPVHLLLTDVIMPKMSGRELASRFRLLLPDVRVLYMTGYASDAIVHHGVLEPGVEMLQKPYTPLALIRRVQEVLHGRTPLRAGAGR